MSDEVKEPVKKVKPKADLSIYEYVSPVSDNGLTKVELEELQKERKLSVTQHLEFLNELDSEMSKLLTIAFNWMEKPSANPYSGIRLPGDSYSTTIDTLLKLQTKAYDAYSTYGEILSCARAIASVRKLLSDNRKARASINEGNTDVERKALASIRSFPEDILLAEIESLIVWAEARYYIAHTLIQTINQLITQKSIEKNNAEKNTNG